MSDIGKSGISYGCALLGYEWVYVPLMRGWGQEPWTASGVGLIALGCGVVLLAVHEFRSFSTRPTP